MLVPDSGSLEGAGCPRCAERPPARPLQGAGAGEWEVGQGNEGFLGATNELAGQSRTSSSEMLVVRVFSTNVRVVFSCSKG